MSQSKILSFLLLTGAAFVTIACSTPEATTRVANTTQPTHTKCTSASEMVALAEDAHAVVPPSTASDTAQTLEQKEKEEAKKALLKEQGKLAKACSEVTLPTVKTAEEIVKEQKAKAAEEAAKTAAKQNVVDKPVLKKPDADPTLMTTDQKVADLTKKAPPEVPKDSTGGVVAPAVPENKSACNHHTNEDAKRACLMEAASP